MDKIEIIDDLELIQFKPEGVLSINSMINYITFIREHEKNTINYNRFTNLVGLSGINLKFTDFEYIIYLVKKVRSEKSKAKSCIYHNRYEVEKLASIVVEGLKPEHDDFLISKNLEECAEYLGIGIEVLKKF